MNADSLSLVCMPWLMLESPSIQIGTLESVVRRAGLACRSHSFHLAFAEFLSRRASRERDLFDLNDYARVSTGWSNMGVGEWVFALPPTFKASAAGDRRVVESLRASGVPARLIARLKRLRDLAPAFLEACADEVLASSPRVVGFTCVYSQTVPSAALAAVLKRRNPELRIVFGGASCEGAMGPALLEAYPCVDVAVSGEAEGVLPQLTEALFGKGPIPRIPGTAFRENGALVEVPRVGGAQIEMDDIPPPNYDEYFERLHTNNLATRVKPQVPFESSRGCWWGMKAHCTFCGLNGSEMTFRSKSPERVLEEVASLSARHGVLDFTAVDNIIDHRYLKTLVPRLVEAEHDLSFFYETKANLSETQVRRFRSAGVRTLQPGIESLSTPTLKLMRKGVTALQNIRLLKWCAQHGVHVIWNLMYGFPGEDPSEYARMADVVPALVHLPPPNLGALMVSRFSPYYVDPEQHGLKLTGPLPWYGLLHDAEPQTLERMAQTFVHTYEDGRDPESYVAPLRDGIERWNREAARNAGALTYRRGPGFLVVTDSRTTTGETVRYTLDEREAAVFDSIAEGASARSIAASTRLAENDVRDILDELLEARVAYEENGVYLALALRVA